MAFYPWLTCSYILKNRTNICLYAIKFLQLLCVLLQLSMLFPLPLINDSCSINLYFGFNNLGQTNAAGVLLYFFVKRLCDDFSVKIISMITFLKGIIYLITFPQLKSQWTQYSSREFVNERGTITHIFALKQVIIGSGNVLPLLIRTNDDSLSIRLLCANFEKNFNQNVLSIYLYKCRYNNKHIITTRRWQLNTSHQGAYYQNNCHSMSRQCIYKKTVKPLT